MNKPALKLLKPQPNQAESGALSIIDSVALLALHVEPIRFIIDQLLPVGLSLLAGSPKIGKSWLALWLCHQVAKGEPVWDYETHQCGALYLALEDTHARLNQRLLRITNKGVANFYFTVNAGTVNGSLITQLETTLCDYPDIGLIVVDTLHRINSNSNGTYADDYEALRTLKSFADAHKIAILLVHHVRKQADSDVFNTILGTTGIMGSVDNVYVLAKDNRTDDSAMLHATGRDIESIQIPLIFDRDTCVWYLNDSINAPLADAVAAVIGDMDSYKTTATNLLEEIKKHIDIVTQPNVLSRRLGEMKPFLEEQYGISIDFGKKNGNRQITISRGDTMARQPETS